ncbi:hypothetical protein P4V47_21930 [Brevibacillus laterosporus]|uniref:Tse2 family ADP-ribosyltransferase toxin n=1 Tax=Brevibacillus laterosporus TaxID=1465 RepID=UPI002E1DA57B|nr:hypothetical protein [Brevibacillus laterosporus]
MNGDPVGFIDPLGLAGLGSNDCPKGKNDLQKTETDLYAFGNKAGPRGARPKQDFNVAEFEDYVGPNFPPLPKGASTVTDVNKAPLSGHYHVLPAGTELPSGLGVIADGKDVLKNSTHGPGHNTIYPTRQMTVNQFNELLKSLPWEYGGKK